MQSVRTPWYADTYPDMHVCGPIYILIPRYMNVQSSVQMHIVGAKYRVRTSPISRAVADPGIGRGGGGTGEGVARGVAK